MISNRIVKLISIYFLSLIYFSCENKPIQDSNEKKDNIDNEDQLININLKEKIDENSLEIKEIVPQTIIYNDYNSLSVHIYTEKESKIDYYKIFVCSQEDPTLCSPTKDSPTSNL